MGASATLPSRDPTATATPSDPGLAWSDLKQGEWQFRRGMIDDAELHRRRDAWRAAKPSSRTPARWAQPTVAELRAGGDHAEADRILGLRRWYDTQRAHARGEEAFTQLNPDFAVLADHRDPAQHQFAADREQALALGTRVAEALRSQNDGRDQWFLVAERVDTATGAWPRAQRPLPERARGGPER